MQKNLKIKAIVDSLVNEYETTDPFIIAKALGIEVRFAEIGTLKGFYVVQHRIPYIVINNTLEYDTARIICAHELGHDRLHRKIAKSHMFNDFEMYLVNSKAELEANVFAANLLISDDSVELIRKNGYSINSAAAALYTSPELLKIKLENI